MGPEKKESSTETFYYLALTWLMSRRQQMFLWEEKKFTGTGPNIKHNRNGILTRTALTVPVKSLTCGFQHRECGMDLDPRAAEFHPRRGKRNREPEKEPDIEEIADEPGSLLDLERHSEESDEQVLGDFQGDQDLEEGSTGEVEHEEGDFASKAIRRTSARNRRPKNLYTYDTLMSPTLRPVNCSVCGEDADVVTCCIQPQLYPLY
ncbi:hypothetical protein QQF64_019460 [Cirrhinus molitorella]|uniref:Uncharacterized protein n=1 Tax=Cirrhinus molitorella TaxID=172907 RepID=A0ABR3LIX3_9TELE